MPGNIEFSTPNWQQETYCSVVRKIFLTTVDNIESEFLARYFAWASLSLGLKQQFVR